MEPTPPLGPDLPGEALAALHQGRKIEAIRIVREARGIGLKEAKDLVDAYAAGQPALQARLAEARSGTTRGCLLVGALGAALAAAVFLYFTRRG